VAAYWTKAKKKPVHLVKQILNKEEVNKGITEGMKERAKLKKEDVKVVSPEESIKNVGNIIQDKKKTKDTSSLELKFNDLNTRIKSFKGKMSDKDKEEINKEIETLKTEVDSL
jgi:chaperonin cofactor prefoldin